MPKFSDEHTDLNIDIFSVAYLYPIRVIGAKRYFVIGYKNGERMEVSLVDSELSPSHLDQAYEKLENTLKEYLVIWRLKSKNTLAGESFFIKVSTRHFHFVLSKNISHNLKLLSKFDKISQFKNKKEGTLSWKKFFII